VGTSVVGAVEGTNEVGSIVDLNTGKLLGTFVGGIADGFNDGSLVMIIVDAKLGPAEGKYVDAAVGARLGLNVRELVDGDRVGLLDGIVLGDERGNTVGI